MPRRNPQLVTNEIYHVFNRGVEKRDIFSVEREYKHFIETLGHYRTSNEKLSRKGKILLKKESANNLAEILCFCLMPNHFHLLLKQISDEGISHFIRKAANSYTRYFNIKNNRVGPLFQGAFKAVRIETDEQLLHVSRYIHINPLTGHIVLREKLTSFPWSSLPEYLRKESLSEEETSKYINKSIVLSHFTSVKGYKRFILDYADYKISQANFQHLFLE